MRFFPLRWFARNVGTFLLAFLLALAVWISAVVTADPNEQHTFRPVSIDLVGLNPELLLVDEIPEQVRVTLKAPMSIWNKLNNNPELIKAWIDLSGLTSGEHILDVKVVIDASPVRFVSIEPAEININLEPLLQRNFTVQIVENGELPLGYKKDDVLLEPDEVIISGRESQVSKVTEARVYLDISGATETIFESLQVEAVDSNNVRITDLRISPRTVNVNQPISLLGGFKNVVVKVVTKGQVANGYRLTNISVSPPTVTLFSENPQLVAGVPGFVETMPVDLTDLSDDVELSASLSLPEGITLVREPNVLVQVSVAAIEGSLAISVPLDVVGLSPEYSATISPESVELIVAGPLNILDTLTISNFRVILDLSGLPPGIYQRSPSIDLTPEQVRVQTTLPETVEVVIELFPLPTLTQTEALLPSPTVSPSPTLVSNPTRTPQP